MSYTINAHKNKKKKSSKLTVYNSWQDYPPFVHRVQRQRKLDFKQINWNYLKRDTLTLKILNFVDTTIRNNQLANIENFSKKMTFYIDQYRQPQHFWQFEIWKQPFSLTTETRGFNQKLHASTLRVPDTK